MQAIVETLFDAVYLTSVIAIGVTMIVKSRGKQRVLAVRHHGRRPWRRRLPSGPRAWLSAPLVWENFIVPLGMGKFITSITMTIFLHHPLLCVAGPVQGQWSKRHYRRRVSAGLPCGSPSASSLRMHG